MGEWASVEFILSPIQMGKQSLMGIQEKANSQNKDACVLDWYPLVKDPQVTSWASPTPPQKHPSEKEFTCPICQVQRVLKLVTSMKTVEWDFSASLISPGAPFLALSWHSSVPWLARWGRSRSTRWRQENTPILYISLPCRLQPAAVPSGEDSVPLRKMVVGAADSNY